MANGDFMNFTALNEKGEVGYALMASGQKNTTRREFERKCLECKQPMRIQLFYAAGFPNIPAETLKGRCLSCHIERKIIATGDLISVCPGRGKGPAVCICGKRENEHLQGRYNGKIISENLCSNLVDLYHPLHRKVESIMKHTTWQEDVNKRTRGMPMLYNSEFLQEARAEGFYSVSAWLDYYPKHGKKIENTWRIRFEDLKR